MQTIFRGGIMESDRSVQQRPRTAMDCITNTHNTSINRSTRGIDKKRRSSATGRIRIKERKSLDFPCIPSQSYPSRVTKQGTFADAVRTSMSRRGYYDGLPEKIGLLQFRRRGYSDSKQHFPLQISVPPTSTLCDIEGRFENPRKAPLPKGLKYNTTQGAVPQSSTSSDCPSTPSTIERTPEFNDLSQASIFTLPKFDPEKEMNILQNLWSKRCSLDDPPLICRSTQQSPEPLEIQDSPQERSFFESDSDSEDEEVSTKRKPWKLGRRSGRGSFSALRRVLIGADKLGLKEFPSIETIATDNWKKTFSLCDQNGERLLVLETSSEETVLVAGSIAGIAFELFRSQDDETRKLIIRSHTVYTTTSRILDTIHACLLNDESQLYWQSKDIAALRIIETLALWQHIQPGDLTTRTRQLCDIITWCTENADDDCKDICNSVRHIVTTDTSDNSNEFSWILKKSMDPMTQEEQEKQLLKLKPWDLAQYLAIYDYLYISHMLSNTCLDDLLSSIVRDDVSILSTPDLRTDQLQYWVIIEILNSPSLSIRVRWICLFIETVMALLELCDYFSAILICNALCSNEVQSLAQTWKKIPQDLLISFHQISETCQTGQSWTMHRDHLQKQPRSSIPYLPCVLRDLRNKNMTQPTDVKFTEGIMEEPVIIPAQPGTGMINLRKFRSMYDLMVNAFDVLQFPYSYWYRLFPEDVQFPAKPKVDEGYLGGWERMRNLVEREIEQCWNGDSGNSGNWERSLHIKKILAFAGF